MNESGATNGNDQSPSSLSIDTLEEIVRNCQRNEQRLHELERHARHERKKAERLLRETSRTRSDHDDRLSSFYVSSETRSNNNNNENDGNSSRRTQSRPKDFFVSLDDDENNRQHKKTGIMQDKHLLERVEKLLAGDGTTTSSDVMSSQERQRRMPMVRISSPVEDDIDEQNQQLPKRSIEDELATVDRLISERTPTNTHRINLDIQLQHDDKPKKPPLNMVDLADIRDRKFYERLNNYVHTGRFGSSSEREKHLPTTTDDETYQSRPVTISHSTQTNTKDDAELVDLARRCEDLLTRLHTQRNRAAMLEDNSYHRRPPTSPSPSREYTTYRPSPLPPNLPPPMSLQQALELLRPEFISRSRQRVRRVRLLREEREHNTEIDRERRQMLLFPCSTCCSSTTTTQQRALSAPTTRRGLSYPILHGVPRSSRLPDTYQEMKRATKKKYEQLPEVNDRRLQNQMNEIRRRNVLRAKVFRTRLRQHVARHGRTDINESLTMIDM